MKLGKCKLCQQDHVALQDSHLVPAAMYRKARASNELKPDPVVMTWRTSVQSSRQLKDYVFCSACEQRLNSGGEHYVMRMIASNGKFPLLESLESGEPSYRLENGFDCYDTSNSTIESDKLVYFSLSVLWRASVHSWRFQDGHRSTIDLGNAYNEALRLYLLGVSRVPENIAIMLVACSDWLSQRSFAPPATGPKVKGVWQYMFTGCGLIFLYFLGKGIDDEKRALSFIHSRERWIFKKDCHDKMLDFYTRLLEIQREYAKTRG